jgi:hypothetical protein
VALTFKVMANPKPEARKKNVLLAGLLALIMLVGGFGLLTKFALGFPGWIVVKILCWILLASLVGLIHRNPSKKAALTSAATLALMLATYMVYFRPF